MGSTLTEVYLLEKTCVKQGLNNFSLKNASARFSIEKNIKVLPIEQYLPCGQL